MSREPQDFLARWSKRKRAAREESAQDSPKEPAQVPEAADNLPAEPAIEVPPDLPDIASLTKDSDFTVFMQENVPEVLRRQALRVLWRSDPVLANLDGLNDYDEDFRILEGITQVVRSNFKPGQGMRDSEDDLEEKEQTEAAQDEPLTPEGTQTAASDPPATNEEPSSDRDAHVQDADSDAAKHN